MKVYISPNYSRNSSETGGIRRVVDAQCRYLPKFGIEVTNSLNQAEIIINHGAMLTKKPGIPMLHVGHGLYWSRQPWEDNFQQVNRDVIESMCQSVAHTVPSEWVGTAVRRGGLFYPTVVYHGVDTDEFKPSEKNEKYVVWAKARADYVSDPGDMQKVAQIASNRQFVSTIGKQDHNVQIVGTLPYAKMNKLVSEAGIYLSTARETFGIGTLEAMACGVPVAGWDCGGNSEIVIQGQTGYLAPWGDFRSLAECIEKCYADRKRLSDNCIEDVRTRWQWGPRIKQYADILERIYSYYYNRSGLPKVSILVTAYKLDQYLPECLESISAQSYQDFECLVIDDAQLKSTEMIVRAFSERDPRIQYVPTPYNLKLSGARNFGLSKARGLYIRHMDADDMLTKDAISMEAEALDRDSSVHIVYGHLETISEDGSRHLLPNGDPERCGWPGPEFNWFQQMSHLNQLPSTVMVRREVYERSGGYRERMKRAEDAEFWCRVTSLGFRAKKVTQAVTMLHRERQDSKGATEWKMEGKEPDWTAWFPWRIGAKDYGEGQKKFRENGNSHPAPHLVPFGAQGKPDKMRMWYVHDYSYPVVSVIMTCGPDHRVYLQDALDSVQAQTFPDWECIVVNDTGTPWGRSIPGAPFAKVINMDGNQGTSMARNAGYSLARGKYVVWLDADDYWLPWFLDRMVAYAEQNDGVIYSDMIQCKIVDGKESFSQYKYQEFQCERAPFGMQYPGSSILYPRKIVQAVFDLQGGYDTNIIGMEDKDFQLAVHSEGFCAYHIEEPLFVYRLYSTSKREKDWERKDEIQEYLDKKWYSYKHGENKMGCGCGSKRKAGNAKSTLTSSGNFTSLPVQQQEQILASKIVQIEYLGPLTESFGVRSRVDPSVTYRFGNNQYHRTRNVLMEDAEYLLGMSGADGPLYRIYSESPVENVTQTANTFLGVVLE